MRSSLLEAAKELARVVVLSVIPVLISSLESNMIDWRTIGVIAAIAGLRAIDKYLHELGKEKLSPQLTAGLTRF